MSGPWPLSWRDEAALSDGEFHQARRYLEALDYGTEFTFQTFSDGAKSKRTIDGCSAAQSPPDPRPAVFHGTLDEHVRTLRAENLAGAGIFVMVNAGDGVVRPGAKTCRTAANVIRVRALFVDLDGAPIQPVLESPIPPHFVVQSSPGRWHAYWRVNDCPLAKFSAAQAALATKFDGDPSVKDLPRVMRVPGFVHRKREPFVSALYLPQDYSSLPGAGRE